MLDVSTLKPGDHMKVIRRGVTRSCVVVATCEAGVYVVSEHSRQNQLAKATFLVRQRDVTASEVH